VPCEFRRDREQIDVSMEKEVAPDPGWEFMDSQGHYHAWSTDGELPTLDSRAEHRDCDGVHLFPVEGECEGYDVTRWSCSVCSEDVEPGTVTRQNVTRYIPGLESWTVVAYDAVVGYGSDRVSLRVSTGTETLFGFAVPTDVTVDSAPGRSRTTLVGTSALGRRK
jgi:hypothetical protein